MAKTLRLDAFLTNLDGLLRPICEKLQMSPSRHDEVEERYKYVGRWLRDCPRLSKYDLRIFPQGSYAIGTTLRPLSRCEFDLDFVLLLQKNWLLIEDAVDLLDMLEERLLSNGKYEGMVERKNRCLRLKYANDFHMDILPAIPNTIGSPSCLLVPDEKTQDWKHSNPEGFRDWFKNRSTERFDSLKQEPLPDYQTLEQKSTLQCAVQLIKRWRDIYYNNRPNVAPVSIVLTTLAARNYGGQTSVETAVQSILDGILREIYQIRQGYRLTVFNPTNEQEDLSERWNTSESYKAFVDGIENFHSSWIKLCNLSGLDERAEALKKLFGEQLTKEVMDECAQYLASSRMGSMQGATSTAGLIVTTSAKGSTPIQPHTFFGGSNDVAS